LARAKKEPELLFGCVEVEQPFTPEEIAAERMRRIQVCVYAYAYEVMNESLISDGEFDKLCLLINPEIDTGNPVMDNFFRTEFDPCTGSWVNAHPEKDKLHHIYEMKRGKKR
jgi:hypothetical protein